MSNENQNEIKPKVGSEEGSASTPNNTKPKDEAEKEVLVPESLLKQINEKLERNEKIIEEQAESIKKLTFAADLNRLNQYDAQHRGALIRTVKLNIFGNKIVLGWQMVKDEVGVTEKGILVEEQIVKLFLDEGEGKKFTTQEMPLIRFSRNTEYQEAEIIKKSTTNDGVETIVVKLPDGRELEMDVRFVN